MKRFVKPEESETLLALVNTLDARHTYNKDIASRSKKVIFVGQLLAHFKIESEVKQHICNATLIHDLGMISVPDSIMCKAGHLTLKERKIIEQAPMIAGEILAPIKSLAAEREIIIAQHEWWNGHGYPLKTEGRDITIGARFVAIVQAVDAMTHNRIYRPARPISYCLQELQANAGKQFEPSIAKVAASLLLKKPNIED
ncbi:MAG: HD domain-containing phosphohydrolase [Mariprofundus sp.]